MKAYLLARVSTEEQNEALPAQTNRLIYYAEQKGYNYSLIEFTESAYSQNRDRFKKIVKEVQAVAEPVVIVFDKIDRYSRDSSAEEVRILRNLYREGKVELHFPSDNLIIHKDSPATDKMRLGLGMILAEYYSDAIRDNVLRRIEQKLQAGEWISGAPFGYKYITRTDGTRDIVPDGIRADAMLFAFTQYATGLTSLKEIRTRWINDFGIKAPVSSIAKRLNNPFYYGMMQSNGKLYPHKYEPLISQEVFFRAEQVRKGAKPQKHRWAGLPFAYRGLINCADCGMRITFETKKKKYTYGHCTQFAGKHNAKYVNEDWITEQLAERFEAIQIPDDVFESISKELKESYARSNGNRIEQVKHLRDAIAKLENRISKLHDEFFDGNISRDIYSSKASEYQTAVTSLKNKLATFELDEDNAYGTVSHLLNLANNAPMMFKLADNQEKRSLIETVLSNLQLDGDQLRSEYKKPFDTMALCAKTQNWCPGVDSNHRP